MNFNIACPNTRPVMSYAVLMLLLADCNKVGHDDALAHADPMEEEELMPDFGMVYGDNVISGSVPAIRAWFLDEQYEV